MSETALRLQIINTPSVKSLCGAATSTAVEDVVTCLHSDT